MYLSIYTVTIIFKSHDTIDTIFFKHANASNPYTHCPLLTTPVMIEEYIGRGTCQSINLQTALY